MAADLTPVYYVCSTAAALGAVLGGARSYYSRQRSRWTDEGARATRQADAMDANTKAASANTQAVTTLTDRLAQFAEETRAQLRSHDGRIGRLEDLAERGMKPRSSRDPTS